MHPSDDNPINAGVIPEFLKIRYFIGVVGLFDKADYNLCL
jgi:hypothetical protein